MTAKSKKVRVAIVGTGGMAARHAECFAKIKECEMVAACDIDLARAQQFAEKNGMSAAFVDVETMLEKMDVDAVSIVTPDPSHYPVTMACLKHGKHVLCEKPLALHAQDAGKMAAAAKKAGVVNMVNFSYRDWPCIQGAWAAVQKGTIGDVRHVEASYLQAWLVSKVWGDWRTHPAWLWRLSTGHGSKGVLGDVGVHIVDFATYPVGRIKNVFCKLKAFPKAPGNKIGAYKLDANDSAVMTVEFESGALGTIHTTRWAPGHANRLALKISGTKGTIDIDSERSTTGYRICSGKDADTGTWKEVECKPVPTNYQRFITAIRKGTGGTPDFAKGAEIQRVLDACFVSDQKQAFLRVGK